MTDSSHRRRPNRRKSMRDPNRATFPVYDEKHSFVLYCRYPGLFETGIVSSFLPLRFMRGSIYRLPNRRTTPVETRECKCPPPRPKLLEIRSYWNILKAIFSLSFTSVPLPNGANAKLESNRPISGPKMSPSALIEENPYSD